MKRLKITNDLDGRHEHFVKKSEKSKIFPYVNASWPFTSSWKVI